MLNREKNSSRFYLKIQKTKKKKRKNKKKLFIYLQIFIYRARENKEMKFNSTNTRGLNVLNYNFLHHPPPS